MEIFEQNDTQQILCNYPFLSYYEDSSFEELIQQCFSELHYKPSAIIECGSEETVKRAVLNQTGIAIIGEDLIREELANGVLMPLHYCTKPIENAVIYLKGRTEEKTIQSFNELLQDTWKAAIE